MAMDFVYRIIMRETNGKKMATTHANDALRRRVTTLIGKVGLDKAAEKVGVRKDTLARFAAGGTNPHAGTVRLIQAGLK